VRKSGALRIGIVLLLASVAAGVFALAGRADDPIFGEIDSSMGPGIVDANANVLVKASWQYLDNRTLNHSSVRFTIPAGWTLAVPGPSSEPDVCSQPNSTTVTCPRGTIRPGDVIAQAVELTTGSASPIEKTVESDLLFSEGPENPGRTQIKPADDVHTTVIAAGSGEPNKVGKCVSNTGGSVSTDPGAGNSETSADVPADPAELCTPISITERIRLNAQEACLQDVACVLDIVTTDSVPFPATDPIELKVTFRGQGINNLPLIAISNLFQREVPACDDDAVADPDPCYSDKKTRQQSVTWTVNWTGVDPTWTG
jgi:hypothetical protein